MVNGIKVDGVARYDNFAKEITVMANSIFESTGLKKEKRMDNAEHKRVELHMHTQMSAMDAVTPCQDLVKRAISWGWNSIAITDHGVVQAFPDAYHLLQNVGMDAIKVIYGVEAYFAPDKDPCVFNSKAQTLDDTEFCILDLETTGISHLTEKITEIGIIKIKNGEEVDVFETFVNPEKPIPERVQEITHITDEMVKDAPTIEEVLPKMIEFIGDSVVVTHNTDFDVAYLKYNYEKYGYKFENTYLDTLRLAKAMFPDFSRYKLGFIADKLGIVVEVAHRALDDVKTLVAVFNKMVENAKDKNCKIIDDFNEKYETDFKKLPTYHMIILAKNYVGLKNLYKIVSYAHVDYFYKKPRVLKSILTKYREGLIIGSACSEGELYKAIQDGRAEEEIEEIANFYDYLEIQPLGNNDYLKREGLVADDEALRDINRKIVALGDKLGKLTVATCDVHFMDPQDELYRRILQAGQKYDDADNQAPLYLRTTDEMLKEFDYFGEEKAYELVVTNTNKIADMCDKISPISPEKCPPHIPGCEEDIKNIAYNKAHELYGEELPEIVQTRLDKELNSIISNGYSVMYIIAQKLVWKSNEDGYIVGSRRFCWFIFSSFYDWYYRS
jgi:DNA polymerase-3 subunit alpha (Gram-positive type)